MTHYISAEHLSIERVGEIIEKNIKLALSDDAKARIVRCRKYLDEQIAASDVPVYGVTTGAHHAATQDSISELRLLGQ